MKTSLSLIIPLIAAFGQDVPPVPPIPPMPPVAPMEVPAVEWEIVVPPIPPIPPLPPMPDMAPLFALKEQFRHLEFAKNFAYMGVPGLAFQKRDRDRGEEQAEREYERGRRAIDKRQYDEALSRFDEVIALAKQNADAGLYWKAYALKALARYSDASATLATMAKSHPQSRWLSDARAMQVEISQAAGKPVSPENAADEDIKLMALNSLMDTDPERALPLLQKLLQTSSSPKLRERALFVLSQSNSPKAREILAGVAKGGANPDLQEKAVRYLGEHGGKENRQLLADVYASSNDRAIKKRVLQSFMVSGERDRLMAIAKSDPNPEMRREAIHYLGTLGANSQLSDLYATETAPEVRERILHSLFISGNSQKLIEVAKTEKDPKLRERAIQHLGTMGAPGVGEALVAMYGNSPEPEIRKKIIQALFVQGNAKQIVEIARKETNPDLKKYAVQQLSHMQNKDATEYLMELLK